MDEQVPRDSGSLCEEVIELPRHQVVVLPDVQVLDEDEGQAMREYVRNGGSIYASGRTASLLPDVFGLVHEGEFADAISYIAPVHPSEDLLPGVDAINPLSVHTRQFKTRALPGGDIRAMVVLPYTKPADTRRFASVHSNPPGISTGYPAVVCRAFGKGKVLWVSAPIEIADKEVHKRSFAAMTKHLADGPFTLEVCAPPAVEVVAFHQPDHHRYLISVVNEQELLPAVPAAQCCEASCR